MAFTDTVNAIFYRNNWIYGDFFFLDAMVATCCIMPIAIMFPLLTIKHYVGSKWEMSVIEIIWGIGMLGRVFSIYFSIAILPSMIGLLFTGFIADAIGIARAFVIAGLIVVLVGVLSFFNGPIRRLARKKV